MKLRTSFFDKATFKKDITRYWPIWALYTVLMLISVLPMMEAERWYHPVGIFNNAIETFALGAMFYAALVASLLFGDLFNSRSCYMLHAMPATRTARFLSHICAGLSFCLIPNLLVAVLAIPYCGQFWFAPLCWLGAVSMQYLFFFGLAVFSVMCTGSRFAAVMFYGILNFFSYIAYFFVQMVFVPMMYGVVAYVDNFNLLCPVAKLMSEKSYLFAKWAIGYEQAGGVQPDLSKSYFEGFGDSWGYTFLIAGVGALLLFIAYRMYRGRKLETAGDFIAVPWLKPVFLVLYTLCAGAFLSVFDGFFGIGNETLFLIIGLIVGFFTGKMLVERTIKVFHKKSFIQFGILILICLLVIGAVKTDLFGIVTYVPEVEDVDYIAFHQGGSKYKHDTPEQIEATLPLHRWALEQRCDGKCGKEHFTIKLDYKLKSGGSVVRRYTICRNEETLKILADISAWRGYQHENAVPSISERIKEIVFIIDGKTGCATSEYDKKAVSQVHAWSVTNHCDGNCGEKHHTLEITYYVEGEDPLFNTLTRTYLICQNKDADSRLSYLLSLVS